jgi:hypothetical protein
VQPLSTRGRHEPALVLTRQQTRPLGDLDEVIGGGAVVDDPVLHQPAAVGGPERSGTDAAERVRERSMQDVAE